jgi:hypothetical protein
MIRSAPTRSGTWLVIGTRKCSACAARFATIETPATSCSKLSRTTIVGSSPRRADQKRLERLLSFPGHTDRVGDHRKDRIGILDSRQPHEEHATGRPLEQVGGDGDREPRFPDPADPR